MALTDEQLIEAGIETGLLDNEIVETLRKENRRERHMLLAKILAHYRIPLSALDRAVAQQQGIPFINLAEAKVNSSLTKKMPASLISRKQMLVVAYQGDDYLVVSEPGDMAAAHSAERLIGESLPLAMAELEQVRIAVKKLLATSAAAQADTVTQRPQTDLVALLDRIIKDAYLSRVSDIHLLTEDNGLRVRFRVDGRLTDYPVDVESDAASGLISRVKVLSSLDIAEQRMPQDGGFSYKLAAPINQEFNIRVATAPTRLGERITMRLLGDDSNTLTLTDIGFLEGDLIAFKKAIKNPYGMILLTGPTGSGKSTTLCAALQEINRPDLNIMTVENPIEYVIDGVSQIQTGPKISFADALRSLLRHDPDVLMVGEIRDNETADVAVKAAMTGHLVLSTLHTNNAVSAVTRLIDIGCEPFLIGSTMTAVIAQRLVRRLCRHCAKARQTTVDEMLLLDIDEPETIYEPIGCAVCQGQGFRGRLGLFETLWFNEKLARMVAKGADEETIESQAGSALKFMWEDGCDKVLRGLTTLDEVRNVAVFKRHEKVEVN